MAWGGEGQSSNVGFPFRQKPLCDLKALRAKRAAPPKVNPAPAGPAGGTYKPLSEDDLKQIYGTSLRLLAELGMGEVPARLWGDLVAAGAIDLGNGRLGFP